MTDCRRLSFLVNRLGLYRKAGDPRLRWEDVINKDLKEMETSSENVKREALNRLGWKRRVRICVGLRRLSAAVSYYYYH